MRGHKEIPSNLKNRLSYLRNALKDVSVLEPLQEEGTALIKRFTDLKKRRNDLMHSATVQMAEGGYFAALSFSIQGRTQFSTQNHVEIADVVLFNKDIQALVGASNAFLRNVRDAVS